MQCRELFPQISQNENFVMMLVRIPSAWDGVDGSNAIQHKDI